MDHNQLFIILIFFCLLVLSIGVVAILSLSKKLLIGFQNRTADVVKRKILEKLNKKNYSLKTTDKKIHVETSHFKALNLHFKQKENNVEVYWEISQSRIGGVLILIGVLIFGVSLILIQFADLKSKELKREIYPLLEDIKQNK